MRTSSVFYFLFVISIVHLISYCSPVSVVTTAPAIMLGAHENSQKREKWLGYARKGDVYAQYELARSYCCDSTEGPLNPEEASRWFCEAAKNGFGKAQVEIGKFYENISEIEGINYPKDNILAYMWYSLASRRAIIEGANLQKELRPALTEQQIKQAERLAQYFTKLNCFTEQNTNHIE